MKFEKYEKPELEEMDLMLEGSFLGDTTETFEGGGGFTGDENDID